MAVVKRVIDRVGKRLRCPGRWYSGRWKKVVKGQNLLGIVLTINVKPCQSIYYSVRNKVH